MLTVDSFVTQYENYTDEELYLAHKNIHDYSTEAQEALFIAIDKRGGLKYILDKSKQKQVFKKEEHRIYQEIKKLYTADTHLDFLKTIIKSEILSPDETELIIEEKYNEIKKDQEDIRIKPRTIFGCIIGGVLGSLIGGALWGLQMIQMHRMFYIFVIGLAILSYGLIRFFTKQSKANVAVAISTILSVYGALLIGQLLFEMYG